MLDKRRLAALLAVTLASSAASAAVTASFNSRTGLLVVVGDARANNIEISRSRTGRILVNDGEVAIVGGTPTTANTRTIQVLAGAGDDNVTLNEARGALPRALLFGSNGNDTLIGGAGRDVLDGGAGNDLLRGRGEVDTVRGGSGNDTLLGDRGNDRVEGGSGRDLIIVNNGDGSDSVDGGADDDTVQVNGADGAGDDFRIDPNGARVRFRRINLGLFAIDISTTERLDVNGQGGNDSITGGAGLVGLIQLDLDGGEGNDLLIGGDGVDTLRGGAGNDTLIGGRANDVMLGERGDDLFVHNNGDGSDFMEGGAGDDTVQVNGADGAGDDFSIRPNGARVRFQRDNLGLFRLDIGTTENLDVNGQGGNDQITGSAGLVGLIELDLDGGEGNDLLIGGDGVDTLRGGAGNDTLIGGRGNDVVLGGNGNDLMVVNNGDGSDLLEGGRDEDIVQVNGADAAGDSFRVDPNGTRVRFRRTNLSPFAADIGTTEHLDVNGQGGDDVLIGSPGLQGRIELDLDGGRGNDLLIGSDSADTLRGGAGNDTLIGGRARDVVLGQDGNDLLIVNNGDGDDFLEGGSGIDTVQVNGSNTAGDDVRIEPNGRRLIIRRRNLSTYTLDVGTTEFLDVNTLGGDDAIAVADLTGAANLIIVDVDGGADDDFIHDTSFRAGALIVGRGGAGNDVLLGGRTAAVLLGGAGRDVLLGSTMDDILLGNEGDDVILGAGGNDTIKGGDGNDLLHGGPGRDFADGGAGTDIAIACETVINVP